MSLKSEKLTNRIQEIQQFIAARIGQDEIFQSVERELTQIANSLKQGKLTVHIASREPISAETLREFLASYQPLSESYYFQTIPLLREPETEPAKPEPTAELVLQASHQTRYKLTANQSIAIGRDDSQCQIGLPSEYVWVSSRHAEIQSVFNLEGDSDCPCWQICDLNSTNGTYINGQRLQDCQGLQAGDRITFGYEEPTEKSPEFIFECQSDLDINLSAKAREFASKWIDCDVLCLVVPPNSMLADEEKRLIEKASLSPVALLVVVVEIQCQGNQPIKTSLAELKSWLQSQNSDLSFELAPLQLRPCDREAKELDKLCKSLEKLVRRKPEDILTKRLSGKVLFQLDLLECSLTSQQAALEKKIHRESNRLREVREDDSQKKTELILKQVTADEVGLFKEIKARINQSKASLLDEYLIESIPCKLSEAVDKLEPCVTKQGGVKYIQLTTRLTQPTTERRVSRSRNSKKEKVVDANTAIVELCRSELNQWVTEEWYRICTFYAEGGLKEFFHQTYQKLSLVPALNASAIALHPSSTIDLQNVFPDSIKKPPCESRYQGVSPVFFILKKVRSQWMQFMFLFSFLSVLGIAGGRRQVIRKLTQPIHGAFSSAPLVSCIILLILGYFLFKYASRTYQSFKKAEQEKAVEKIRNELRSYYQSLVKNRLVDKYSQRLMLALEAEEQRLDELVNKVQILTEQMVTKTENHQLPLKQRMNQWKAQQMSFKKDLSELQKLKRI